MNLYVRIFLVIFFCCNIVLHSFAQNGAPWSKTIALSSLTEFLFFPEPVEKIEEILNEERNNQSALKAFLFAVNIETSINPLTSGQWDTIPAKGYVWRLGIHAENALSINLFLENYRMQPGMALFVYSASNENLTAGPFDINYNVNGGVLPVQSLQGDSVIVEWNIPLEATPRYDFTIACIGYGFRDINAEGKIERLAEAMNCNIDINCLTGNHWQREKRSVVRLEIKTDRGSKYCTGTLVNQDVESERKKPYILTAYHCVSNSVEAQGTTFVFQFDKPYCDYKYPVVITANQVKIGANFVAGKEQLDFALLELKDNNIDNAYPFYAGWNASNSAVQGVVGIHHPQGDTKKISVSNGALITSTFTDSESDLYCDIDAHWTVKKWDDGLTEQGSSGSAIFDPEHLVVGTLSGGPKATCTKAENDQYSKFSEQWNRYPNSDEQLKHWLDPDNKGISELGGYDPVANFDGKYIIYGNIGENEKETLVKSDEWGYLTSQNDKGWLGFAEKFDNDTTANIIGMEVYIAKVSDPGVNVEFAIWRGTTLPIEPPLQTKKIVVTPDYKNYKMHVYFDKAATIDDTDNFFIGYKLGNSSPTDTFAVYQTPVRPFTGLSAMYVEETNGKWMALDAMVPPINASMFIKAIGVLSKQSKPQHVQLPHKNLKLIYEQGTDNLLILFDDYEQSTASSLIIECYDTSGKRLLSSNKPNGSMQIIDDKTFLMIEIDVTNLPAGIYIVQAYDKNKKRSGKFLKLK